MSGDSLFLLGAAAAFTLVLLFLLLALWLEKRR